jgi:hypothetical protein
MRPEASRTWAEPPIVDRLCARVVLGLVCRVCLFCRLALSFCRVCLVFWSVCSVRSVWSPSSLCRLCRLFPISFVTFFCYLLLLPSFATFFCYLLLLPLLPLVLSSSVARSLKNALHRTPSALVRAPRLRCVALSFTPAPLRPKSPRGCTSRFFTDS